MKKNTYTIINKFECYGVTMVVVVIKGKAACIMSEADYNRIIEAERKYKKKNRPKVYKTEEV